LAIAGGQQRAATAQCTAVVPVPRRELANVGREFELDRGGDRVLEQLLLGDVEILGLDRLGERGAERGVGVALVREPSRRIQDTLVEALEIVGFAVGQRLAVGCVQRRRIIVYRGLPAAPRPAAPAPMTITRDPSVATSSTSPAARIPDISAP